MGVLRRMKVLLFLLLVGYTLAQVSGGLVTGLPGGSKITDKSYAGYVTVDPVNESKFFYWFFESRNNASSDPVVLWMTGGPGCSSELAVVFENGPFSINDDYTLEPNPYSWNNNASVLYIDQPFGTGYSPISPDVESNEEIIATYVYKYIQGFLTAYPQYRKNNFFVTGESYAGHYIPAVTNKIVHENLAGVDPKINLKGAAIGNGWVAPQIQYGAYGPFAKQNNLIGTLVYEAIAANYIVCTDLINHANTTNKASDWVVAEDVCSLLMEEVLLAAPKIDGHQINVYNIKEPCTIAGLCYNFTVQTNYFNMAATKTALHVANTTKWSDCSTIAGLPLLLDRIHSFSYDLPDVLANGVPVLVYSGMDDLICNYVGGNMWTSQMAWPGQTQFNNAPLNDWTVNGQVAGHAKTYNGFTFLEVENAGHMVPHDQPAVALAMLNQFMAGKPFP